MGLRRLGGVAPTPRDRHDRTIASRLSFPAGIGPPLPPRPSVRRDVEAISGTPRFERASSLTDSLPAFLTLAHPAMWIQAAITVTQAPRGVRGTPAKRACASHTPVRHRRRPTPLGSAARSADMTATPSASTLASAIAIRRPEGLYWAVAGIVSVIPGSDEARSNRGVPLMASTCDRTSTRGGCHGK